MILWRHRFDQNSNIIIVRISALLYSVIHILYRIYFFKIFCFVFCKKMDPLTLSLICIKYLTKMEHTIVINELSTGIWLDIRSWECPDVSTTPLRRWGLPFSWTTLRGKHCRHSIALMGVVDTFGQCT